jgi:hypothetical protein
LAWLGCSRLLLNQVPGVVKTRFHVVHSQTGIVIEKLLHVEIGRKLRKDQFNGNAGAFYDRLSHKNVGILNDPITLYHGAARIR